MVKHSFAVAAHSYFRILNKEYAKRRFLGSRRLEPTFSYTKIFSSDLLQRRILNVSDPNVTANFRVALAGARLQADESQDTLDDFRSANAALYGVPEMSYVVPILAWLKSKVTDETMEHFDYILSHTNLTSVPGSHRVPSQSLFERYQSYLRRYIQIDASPTKSIATQLRQALRSSGLYAKGWRVVERDDASHGHVSHQQKRVYIGKRYVPRSKHSALRIVIHEVYGHALRGPQPSISESEGFATLLEQLTSRKFSFVRSFRYLAAAAGWGTLGTPMTFRQVYEIIWRAMVIAGKYDEAGAKRHAFDECVRVFRGGRPDIAGAVFLKDSLYFKANLDMWQVLQADNLDYNEFVDIIEGRRTVL